MSRSQERIYVDPGKPMPTRTLTERVFAQRLCPRPTQPLRRTLRLTSRRHRRWELVAYVVSAIAAVMGLSAAVWAFAPPGGPTTTVPADRDATTRRPADVRRWDDDTRVRTWRATPPPVVPLQRREFVPQRTRADGAPPVLVTPATPVEPPTAAIADDEFRRVGDLKAFPHRPEVARLTSLRGRRVGPQFRRMSDLKTNPYR